MGLLTACSSCENESAMLALPEHVWEVVDPLLARRFYWLVHEPLMDLGLGPIRATELADARKRYLQRTRPDEFPPDPAPKPPTREAVLAKAAALSAKPVAIEAYWSGDTNGWYVVLTAVVSAPGKPEGFEDCDIICLREGSDLRLFNGEVPPWPEAVFALDVGNEIAERLGVPFYFASPNHPEEDCPRWWNRDEGVPCAGCAIPLLRIEGQRWTGYCNRCDTGR
jgi:hypothetical protein